MGSSSKGRAPAPPDPVATAGAQTSMNIGTGIAQQALNTNNQITPYGNLTYNQTGNRKWNDPLTGKTFDLPQYTATQTMSPAQQGLYDQQTRAGTNASKLAADQTARLGSILGKPVNLSSAPAVGKPSLQTVGAAPALQNRIAGSGNIGNTIANAGNVTRTYGDDAGYAAARKSVEGALMSRINPQLEQERSRLSAQLANQGIKQGTEAYDRAISNYGQRANDAQMQAILGAGEEQTRLAGLDQARAQFQNSAQSQAFGQNTARSQFANEAQAQRFSQNAAQGAFRNDALQQGFSNRMAGTGFNNDARQQGYQNQVADRGRYLNEQYASRNQPINEIAALLGTGQVQNPNFVSTPQTGVAGTDYAGLVNSNYDQRLSAWQQQQQQRQELMGGLFGLGTSLIKASDRRLKERETAIGELDGLTVYEFSYLGEDARHVGFMAQDVAALYPDAVVTMPNGFLAVDYARFI